MSLQDLDIQHIGPLRQAITNILHSPHGELTYAQIIDGMPISSVYTDDHWYYKDYLVLEHKTLCPGVMERTQAFCLNFNFLSIKLDAKTIQAYQNAPQGSVSWKLRLLELVIMICHKFAIYLYQMDTGVHKHAEWTGWVEKRVAALPKDSSYLDRNKCGPVTPFIIAPYHNPEEFPDGIADIVGYWAEHRIFGGIILFDRGKSKEECNGIYLHNTLNSATLAPPTESQFKSIIDFLLSPNPDYAVCPLPIKITTENKWRWNPLLGKYYYNIFKYPYEVPEYLERIHSSRRKTPEDWPEIEYYSIIEDEMEKMDDGEPFDKALVAAGWEKIKPIITPTSPLWKWVKEEMIEFEPDEDKRGRPPYFFD